MKTKKIKHPSSVATSINRPFECCALHVVVYRAPGPDDNEIQAHADRVATRNSACRIREALGVGSQRQRNAVITAVSKLRRG